jgi:pyruvate formate lyase activating enzyme
LIRSLTGTSLIEYPDKISSIIFISGCNLQCPYCHNPELVRPDMLDEEFGLTHEEIIKELLKREGFVEAVTVTGGEPLLYNGIVELIQSIKTRTSLSVKVDTNGTYPRKLKEVLRSVDYIAMDIKSSPSKYQKATGGKAVFSDILDSIDIIMSLPAYEFRTTMVPGIVDRDDVIELLQKIGKVRRYVLQNFHSHKTLSAEFMDMPTYPKGYLEDKASIIREMNLAEEVAIRS